MRKSVYALCEQQRRRSACICAQSDQRLCCSLLWQYTTYTCHIQNFKTLASFCTWAGWFESYLVGNLKDSFSRDVAHFIQFLSKPIKVVEQKQKISMGNHLTIGKQNLAL